MKTPDKWVIVKIPQVAKVMGSWSGGYLDGDSWQLSSGLDRIEEDPDDSNYWLMHNVSGSVYKCHKEMEGMNIVASGIFDKMKTMSDEVCIMSVEEFNEAKK